MVCCADDHSTLTLASNTRFVTTSVASFGTAPAYTPCRQIMSSDRVRDGTDYLFLYISRALYQISGRTLNAHNLAIITGMISRGLKQGTRYWNITE